MISYFFTSPYYVYGGERGIWTHDRVLALYMISNHAPSAARTALHGLHIVSLFSSCCPRDEHPMCKCGRGDRIRTCDLLVPNQARYQTALRPVNRLLYNTIFPPKVNEFFTTFLKKSNFFYFSRTKPCYSMQNAPSYVRLKIWQYERAYIFYAVTASSVQLMQLWTDESVSI